MGLALRVLVQWPLFAAIGWFCVIWLYDRVAWDYSWEEINNFTSFALVAWLVAPALHWLALPADPRRPRWPLFTIANAGAAILLVTAIQMGFFAYDNNMGSILEWTAYDWLRLTERLQDMQLDRVLWDPLGFAIVPFAQALAYSVGLAMMARSLALVHAAGAVLAGGMVYLLNQDAIGRILEMFGNQDFAGLATYKLAGIVVLAVIFGLTGAVAVLIWAFALDRHEDETIWQ